MKDNLPYFSHDNNARRHPKMKALIAEFGYEGYGRFWALNERIAETSGACIDISRKVNKLDLAQELGFNGEELERFLAFLTDPEIDLINLADNKITTDRITETFEKTMEAREEERDRKKGKRNFPGGNNQFPGGKDDFPGGFRPEKDTDKTKQDKTKQEEFSNSDELSNVSKTTSLTAQSLPKSKGHIELTEEQKPLFHAARLCFESDPKAKALLYQDKNSTARQMKDLKMLVIRCTNMAPGITADFLRNVLEHFRALTNGRLKNKAAFTPCSLATRWVWELVIESLPENTVTPELQESIRGLFK